MRQVTITCTDAEARLLLVAVGFRKEEISNRIEDNKDAEAHDRIEYSDLKKLQQVILEAL